VPDEWFLQLLTRQPNSILSAAVSLLADFVIKTAVGVLQRHFDASPRVYYLVAGLIINFWSNLAEHPGRISGN
jgi:hypothetical protein